jgi:serine/threonine-protein kinase
MAVEDSSPLILGRYALYDRIAAGGMASVHLGRLLGPAGFARTVAIKRLHQQFAGDPEFVSMFMDEARLAARISHPNVVPTLDVVATGGELFLVMEYVRGESLSRLLRATMRQPDPVPPAGIIATIVANVLHGLHAAHEAKNERGEPLGIVHRDVSPHNVLVGIDGVARVLDFGIAKAVGRVATTRDGQLKGKLAYMAPEQMQGRVTRTTDVYAAAIVLWEGLTGTRLFAADNEAWALQKVLAGCDTPPSRYVPSLPVALDDVVMRGLRREPAERFQTAHEMALALEAAVPVVTMSQVTAWVETLAGDTIAERSAQIARIESSSDASALAAVGATEAEEDGATQLATGSTSAPGGVYTTRKRRRRAVGIGAVGLASVGAVGVLALALSRRAPPPVAGPSLSVPAPPAPIAVPADLPDLASGSASASGPTASGSAEEATSAAPVASASARPHAPARPRTDGPASRHQPPPPPPVVAPTCTVATDYDSDGQPHFHKVCQ